MGPSQEKRIREMREIKFRGKKISNGQWVHGYLTSVKNDYAVIEYDNEDGRYNHLVYANTVGQYTGLEDEDGVEIFEGDIVEVHEAPFNWSIIGVVIYDPETARFLIREQNKKYPRDFPFQKHDTYNDGYCTVECESNFHVFGNIHDNPELL